MGIFGKLEQELTQEDEGTLVPLKDKAGNEYVNEDGTRPQLRIVGPYSSQVRAAENRTRQRMLAKKQAKLTADELDRSIEERAAAALVGWEHLQDDNGQPVPYSKENAAALIKFPWVAAQVTEYVAEYSDFFRKG